MTNGQRITAAVVSIMTLCACAVFASTLVHASLYYQAEDEATPAQAGIAISGAPAQGNPEIPAHLLIPAIGVDAHVQDVGIGKSGNMAVPTNFTDVGWYRYGPAPGQKGSAVIDGHVDNGFGMDAVFKKIGALAPGDDIYVKTKDDRTVRFVVTGVETYPADDVPKELLFTRDDASRLNLITCAGTWESDKKAYDERVVVYAILAP
jgi:LPXTG-site transpeptidase (sortase) family protein